MCHKYSLSFWILSASNDHFRPPVVVLLLLMEMVVVMRRVSRTTASCSTYCTGFFSTNLVCRDDPDIKANHVASQACPQRRPRRQCVVCLCTRRLRICLCVWESSSDCLLLHQDLTTPPPHLCVCVCVGGWVCERERKRERERVRTFNLIQPFDIMLLPLLDALLEKRSPIPLGFVEHGGMVQLTFLFIH